MSSQVFDALREEEFRASDRVLKKINKVFCEVYKSCCKSCLFASQYSLLPNFERFMHSSLSRPSTEGPCIV